MTNSTIADTQNIYIYIYIYSPVPRRLSHLVVQACEHMVMPPCMLASLKSECEACALMSLVGGTAGLLVGALSASLVGHQLGYWSASPDISVAAPTAPFSKSEPEPEWTVPESPKWEPPLKPAPAPAPEPPSPASSEGAASASWVAPALVTVTALAAAGAGGKWAPSARSALRPRGASSAQTSACLAVARLRRELDAARSATPACLTPSPRQSTGDEPRRARAAGARRVSRG